MNAFTSMVSFLDGKPQPAISKKDYEVFQKEYLFDILKGKRYGRAFCERFHVNDTVVSCLVDEDLAKEIIETSYIQ